MRKLFVSMLAVSVMFVVSCSEDEEVDVAQVTTTSSSSAKASAKPATITPQQTVIKTVTAANGKSLEAKNPVVAASEDPKMAETVVKVTKGATTESSDEDASAWYFDGNVYDITQGETANELLYSLNEEASSTSNTGGLVFYADGIVAAYSDEDAEWNWGYWYVDVVDDITYLAIDDLEDTTVYAVDEIEDESGNKSIVMITFLEDGSAIGLQLVESSVY